MKNNLWILFLFLGFYGFSQNADKVPIKKMPVHPKCIKLNAENKNVMSSCLQRVLQKQLERELKSFWRTMDKKELKTASAKISFVISNKGKIINSEVVDSSFPPLGEHVKVVFNKIANETSYIQPGEDSNGKKVNMSFHLPVRYNILDDDEEEILALKEVVLATLIDENEKYEIRMNILTSKIIIYDISGKTPKYLNAYKNTLEALQLEPYKTLFLKMGNEILITEGQIKDQTFRVYTFIDQKDMLFIYRMDKGKEVFVRSLTREKFNSHKEFSQLIFR